MKSWKRPTLWAFEVLLFFGLVATTLLADVPAWVVVLALALGATMFYDGKISQQDRDRDVY